MARPPTVERPSPNHNDRPAGVAPSILLLHYTGMTSAAAALDRLTDPAAEVSAHYLVDEDGTVYRLVAEDRRAWHAGRAFWAGETDINGHSIGIELVNPGHEFGYRPFPEAQIASLAGLAHDILSRHPIPAARVLAHSDVAPDRKEDPGELFPWARLAAEGIGLWPGEDVARPDGPMPFVDAQRLLSEIGYGVEATGRMDAATRAVLVAFQRHWLPQRLSGALTPETCVRIRQVWHAATS